MKIFGIDPSLTSTGICIANCRFLDKHKNFLSEILLKETNSYPKKAMNEVFDVERMEEIHSPKNIDKELKKIRKEIRNGEESIENILQVKQLLYERMQFQAEQIYKKLEEYKPEFVFMEDYSFHSQGSLTQMAEIKGYLYSQLFGHSFLKSLFLLPITTIKRVASTKGKANKETIYNYIQRFPLGLSLNKKNDDEIDALAICLTAFYGIYEQLFSIIYPESSLRKEKNYYNTWKGSFKKMTSHIGKNWNEYIFTGK